MNYNLPDKTNEGIVHMIRVIAAKGKEIPGFISFAIGNPAEEAIPLESMKAAVHECAEDNPIQYLQYGSSAGYQKLIDQTTERLIRVQHLPEKNRDILMLSGSGQGLGLFPRTFCREGDEIYVEEYSYTNALNAIINGGCRAIPIKTDEKGMIPEELDKAAYCGHGKMIYLNPNFQNPTGTTIPLERRKELYEVARKHNLLIYEDDPYGEIRFQGDAVPAFASFDTEGRVIYAGSYSKTLSAGMRVGFLYGEKEVIAALRKIKESTEGQIAHLNEMVISKTMDKIDYNKHIQNICAIYKEKCQMMIDSMEKYCSKKMKIIKPDGGMFVWVTFPDDTDTDLIMKQTLKRGVGIVPGQAFMADETRICKSFRLNFTYVDKESIDRGIQIFGEVTKEICGE